MTFNLRIDLLDRMTTLGILMDPMEACGFLLAPKHDRQNASEVLQLSNIAPQGYFEIAPDKAMTALKSATRRNMRHVAVWHTHPTKGPDPSDTDVKGALLHPRVTHIIVSLGEAGPEVKAFRVTLKGELIPEAIEITTMTVPKREIELIPASHGLYVGMKAKIHYRSVSRHGSTIVATIIGIRGDIITICPSRPTGPTMLHVDRIKTVEVIREGPWSKAARLQASTRLRRGAYYLANGDFDKARDDVNMAQRLVPYITEGL